MPTLDQHWNDDRWLGEGDHILPDWIPPVGGIALPDWIPPVGGIATASNAWAGQIVTNDVPFGFIASVREGGPSAAGAIPRPLSAAQEQTTWIVTALAGIAMGLLLVTAWPYERCGHCLALISGRHRVCGACGSARSMSLALAVSGIIGVGAAWSVWILIS